MKILLTGGTGFIGQNLLREFAKSNYFTVATRKNNFEDFFAHENVEYVNSDYSYESFLSLLNDIDGIIHLASKRSSEDNEKSIDNYLCNIKISENIFNAAKKYNVKNIVNISTCAVYSENLTLPFEENECLPISNYAVSKLCTEYIAELFNKKYGMHIKSMRLSQVLGLGERKGSILSSFLENSINKKALCVYGKGEQAKDYIYVKDAVNGIMKALHNTEKSGVYNLGSGVMTSNLELAQLFCKVFKNEAGYVLDRNKKESSYCSLLDMTKSKTELMIEIKYTFEQALEDMKNYI